MVFYPHMPSVLLKTGMIPFKLFEPKSDTSDLKVDYPELASIPEFKRLTTKKLKFAYYYGCRWSEHYKEIDHTKKVDRCLRDSGLKDMPKDDVLRYMEKQWEDDVVSAIRRFESFNPSVRLQAKMMYEKMLEMTKTVLEKSMADLVTADAGGRKDIMDIINKANNQIPELVKQLEDGWGITESKKKGKSDDDGKSPTEVLMESEEILEL